MTARPPSASGLASVFNPQPPGGSRPGSARPGSARPGSARPGSPRTQNRTVTIGSATPAADAEEEKLRMLEQENAALRDQVARLKSGVVYMASTSSGFRSPRAQSASPRRAASPRAPSSPRASTVSQMDHEQMVREAQLRQLHNRQRAQLKAYLQLSAGNGETIDKDDLQLAAKLAKMSLPDDNALAQLKGASGFITKKAEDGSPRDIQWKAFLKAMEPPPVASSRSARDTRRAVRKSAAEKKAAMLAASGAAADAGPKQATGPIVTEKELVAAHTKIRNHFATRFTEVRRGFRLLDEDHSGKLSYGEMKAVLMMFNLDISGKVLSKLIEIADMDGDGDIDYAEFARIMTAENILALKDTKSGDPGGTGQKAGVTKITGLKGADPLREGGPTLRPGVTAKEVQYAQRMLRQELEEKYASLTKAFKFIDADRTGFLEREEMKRLLVEFNITDVSDGAIETLIDFADYGGDGEIAFAEFARVMTADDIMNMKSTLQAA